MTALPATMTAIAIKGAGGPEVLQPEESPVPKPGPGEILVKVAAAGVNRPDVLQRRGGYPPPPGAPSIPGLEIAGEIVAAGEGVDTAHIGQRVCALVAGGGYAEYCVAPAGTCLPVPEVLSLTEAAAMPETLFTVWSNLFERGFAAEGDTVLVHGGTSGIGTMAIALGRLFGVTSIVTCGSDSKCRRAEQLGADSAINYRTQDFVEAMRPEAAAERFAGLGVVGDGDPRLEEPGQHLAPGAPGLIRLVRDSRVAEDVQRHGIRRRGDLQPFEAGACAVELQRQLLIPVFIERRAEFARLQVYLSAGRDRRATEVDGEGPRRESTWFGPHRFEHQPPGLCFDRRDRRALRVAQRDRDAVIPFRQGDGKEERLMA